MKIALTLILILINFNLILSAGGNRPPINQRKFSSIAIDNYIENLKYKFKNSDLAKIYENCFPNTLDTTVEFDEKNQDTFIITGDIEAMWLRDSSFQIFAYIQFAKEDPKLKKMMLNLIKRQSKSILIDPYANAFNKDEDDSPWQSDETYKLVDGKKILAMNKKLWERKYELDSPISTLFFSHHFFESTGDLSFIDDITWIQSLELIIDLVKKQMRGFEDEDKNGGPEYIFQRHTSEPFDSLHQGRGSPVTSCGLVKTMFRNSDDAVTFAYNIPENAFLVAVFKKVIKMMDKYIDNYSSFDDKKRNIKYRPIKDIQKLKLKNIVSELENISNTVEQSIYENGVFMDPKTGEKYFAYEVDCYGNHYFIDDPGYPSLTALPFFDFIDIKDPLYISTRKRVLSNKNPYFFKNSVLEGMGSAHTSRNFIWPLFNIMRVITSNDEKEIMDSINLLLNSAMKTGFIHESFNINNFDDYTRSWFAWANSFFGYMINKVVEKYPKLLLK